MRNLIRRWLGLDDITERLSSLQCKGEGQSLINNETLTQVRVLISGMGRIIAKVDPVYGVSYDDPQRRAESDKLGADIIKRLQSEDAARRRTTGQS